VNVDQFLDAFSMTDERYELVDGVPVEAVGAGPRHSRIQGNLLSNLHVRLGDGPCEVFGANMGLQVGEHDLRFPDAAIYCDPADVAPENDATRFFNRPRVLFEIVSASTADADGLNRLIAYQRLPSVDTIVQIDSDHCILTTYVRAADNAWTMMTHPPGSSLRLRDPEIVLTSDEIFRRVPAPAQPTADMG
jgi:Uma2 family endonuclease